MYRIEAIDWYRGKKFVVIFLSRGYRCGYVAVTPDSPLYGIEYTQDLLSPELLQEIKFSQIGKRGLIDVFLWDGESSRISMIVNVHGGITYSGSHHSYPTNQFDPVWWFGFDCNHYQDGKDLYLAKKYFHRVYEQFFEDWGYSCRSLGYCIDECKSMIDQIICVEDTLKETRLLLS
jgi:hypothetical protein